MDTTKKEKFLDSFGKNMCNISKSCKKAGVSRQVFYQWCKEDSTFKKEIENHQEALLDEAETKLIESIREKNTSCLIFYLKTKGKYRGYTERIEQKISLSPFEELMKKATSKEEE